MPKPEYRIENWSMGSPEPRDPYRAPETYRMHLFGTIIGHPTCTPGGNHITSQIKAIDLKNRRVETRNSMYHLGKIDPKFYEFSIVDAKKPETIETLKSIYALEIMQ